ncbi:hypothetical protein GGI15_002027 [Coemansia interrupta]|uniref:Myb-like domain-containing protein n=1 Tax=Coemansia interrupta TaxID=1126814 RepID=A0A9W8HJ34_9FUNG|nr:hypothetical protein GGI15_002027 [Coemansia interrupta]
MSLILPLVHFIRQPASKRRWISALSAVAASKTSGTSAPESARRPDLIVPLLKPKKPREASTIRNQNDDPKPSAASRPRQRWSLADKKRLVQAAESCRKAPGGLIAWAQVQQLHFQDRTAIACRDAYIAILKSNGLNLTSSAGLSGNKLEISDKSHARHSLTERERSELPRIVCKHGERNWDAVAEEMAQVDGIHRHKGVYHSMWNLYLCPRMQTAPLWDAEKAERLKQLAAQHGKDDVFLAYKFFPEYSPAALRVMLRRMDTRLAAVDYRVNKRGIKG